MAVLYAFAGLPGVGKTSLVLALASIAGATYLRVDALEQDLRRRTFSCLKAREAVLLGSWRTSEKRRHAGIAVGNIRHPVSVSP